MKKIIFITTHPAPYRDEVLHRVVQSSDFEFLVYNINCDAWNHKEWLYTPHKFNRYLQKKIVLPKLGAFNFEIFREIKKNNPSSLLISGYYPLTMMLALLYAKMHKIPYALALDTISSTKYAWLKNFFYKGASAFWVPGRKSMDYLEKCGIRREKIYQGYYTNNVYAILKCINSCSTDKLKKELGITNSEYVFLFIGKLTAFRRINVLLEGLTLLEANIKKKFRCIIIGDGEDAPKVEEAKKQLNSLIYIPSVKYNNIHDYYAISNCYVHPGVEPYSLALAEAALAKLAIIARSEVGATADYLKDGENGYLFDGSSNDIAIVMQKALNREYQEDKIEKMYHYAKGRNTEWAAEELKKVLNKM